MIGLLAFVVLLIALVWLILYCFYLKELIKATSKGLSYQSAELQETKRLMRSLANKCGYELRNNADWIKGEVK